jgi:hypothetical protein
MPSARPPWRLIREAGDLGHLTVVNDTDSQDRAVPGVDRIVANMTPEGDAGAVVLLHDAGGDRKQTVEALEVFIPRMLALQAVTARSSRSASTTSGSPHCGRCRCSSSRTGSSCTWC